MGPSDVLYQMKKRVNMLTAATRLISPKSMIEWPPIFDTHVMALAACWIATLNKSFII
jgi:hypothetical protein